MLGRLLVIAFAAMPASAELTIDSIRWQAARVEKARVRSWGDILQLVDGPPKLDSRLRARLTLKNAGSKPAKGILLRYSMTARVAPEGGIGGDVQSAGVWAIAFMVGEHRVPKVGPNQIVDVPLSTSPALDLYLNKLSRAGWWPDRVKLQVMIEPHAGTTALQSLESVLEVRK